MKTEDIAFGLRATGDNIGYTEGFLKNLNEKEEETTMQTQDFVFNRLNLEEPMLTPDLSFYKDVVGLVEEEHFYWKSEKLLFTRLGIDYLIYTLNINVQLEVVNSVQSQCVIKATASFLSGFTGGKKFQLIKEREYQSLGSVNTTTYNVSESGNYMVEKAEQRAKCRAVLGLLGFKSIKGIYGSEEF